MRTREQQRARDAYDKILRRHDDPHKDRYGRVCVHLPEMIHRNGLCQTVAFLQAKKGAGAQGKLWFGQALEDLAAITNLVPNGDFAAAVRAVDSTEYQRYTREALACAQWLKRYAEAVLKVDVSQQVTDR